MLVVTRQYYVKTISQKQCRNVFLYITNRHSL